MPGERLRAHGLASHAARAWRTRGRCDLALKPELLIVDEVGYIPFGRPATNLFFQVVNGRYKAGSTIINSNRAFSGWGEIFGGDVVVAAAMIDRLVHHAEIISLKGSSYRLKGKEGFIDSVAKKRADIPSQGGTLLLR